jgi:protein-tyrosine-phosphatase
MGVNMNILFVCKHNRFRSKIAEAYFNNINKNKNIHAKSAGVILGSYPFDKNQFQAAKSLGINMIGKPQGLSTELLSKIDLIIIVADNVPKRIFHSNIHKKKVIVWEIKDINSMESKVLIEKKIEEIMKKVNGLIERLNKEK